MTYGKLVERILTFRKLGVSFAEDLLPVADARLEQLKSVWGNHTATATGMNDGIPTKTSKTHRVAVFGDASSSMSRAIEAASIFASMVSVCFDAELSFFGWGLVRSPHPKPRNVQEALEICDKVRASGCTCLAAALWPYFESKTKMDLFVMVTDEEENTNHEGYNFAALLAAYRRTVHPDAKLVVVRVGRGCRRFQGTLREHGIDYKTVVVDGERPDHAKFDALLGQIAMIMDPTIVASVQTNETNQTGSRGRDENRNGNDNDSDGVLVDALAAASVRSEGMNETNCSSTSSASNDSEFVVL